MKEKKVATLPFNLCSSQSSFDVSKPPIQKSEEEEKVEKCGTYMGTLLEI